MHLDTNRGQLLADRRRVALGIEPALQFYHPGRAPIPTAATQLIRLVPKRLARNRFVESELRAFGQCLLEIHGCSHMRLDLVDGDARPDRVLGFESYGSC